MTACRDTAMAMETSRVMGMTTGTATGTTTHGPARMGMVTDTEAWLTLARWLSPAYPTGGFAWSHGLETAVAEGWVHDAASLGAWLDDLLRRGSGRSDAILLAAAWRADAPDVPGLADLARALAPSAERRAEGEGQGAAFAAAARAVAGPASDLPDLPLPVAIGRAAALAGLPLDLTLALHLQNFVTGQVQAALRLMPLGQSAGQRVLAGLAPAVAEVAREAAVATLDDLGTCAFGLDLASMRHETHAPRLFRS